MFNGLFSFSSKSERRRQRQLSFLVAGSFLVFLPLTFLLVDADEILHSVTIGEPEPELEVEVEFVEELLIVPDTPEMAEVTIDAEGRKGLGAKSSIQVKGVRASMRS